MQLCQYNQLNVSYTFYTLHIYLYVVLYNYVVCIWLSVPVQVIVCKNLSLK